MNQTLFASHGEWTERMSPLNLCLCPLSKSVSLSARLVLRRPYAHIHVMKSYIHKSTFTATFISALASVDCISHTGHLSSLLHTYKKNSHITIRPRSVVFILAQQPCNQYRKSTVGVGSLHTCRTQVVTFQDVSSSTSLSEHPNPEDLSFFTRQYITQARAGSSIKALLIPLAAPFHTQTYTHTHKHQQAKGTVHSQTCGQQSKGTYMDRHRQGTVYLSILHGSTFQTNISTVCVFCTPVAENTITSFLRLGNKFKQHKEFRHTGWGGKAEEKEEEEEHCLGCGKRGEEGTSHENCTPLYTKRTGSEWWEWAPYNTSLPRASAISQSIGTTACRTYKVKNIQLAIT